MRKIAGVAAFLMFVPTGATAQVSVAIAQTLASKNGPLPDKCYDGRWSPSANDIDRDGRRAEAVMVNYRQLAASGSDVSKIFTRDKSVRDWQLDGESQDIRAVHDPWIGRIARLERVVLRPGNATNSRAEWRAYAADGTEIGLYDVWLNMDSSRINQLNLYSPGAKVRPLPDTPFCVTPGDVEEWKSVRASRQK